MNGYVHKENTTLSVLVRQQNHVRWFSVTEYGYDDGFEGGLFEDSLVGYAVGIETFAEEGLLEGSLDGVTVGGEGDGMREGSGVGRGEGIWVGVNEGA